MQNSYGKLKIWQDVNMEEDDDPFDRFSEGREFGLLLRTDFSNEEAWQSFCNQLEDNEKQLAEAIKADETPQTDSSRPEIIDSDDEDSMEGVPFPIIKILILDSSSPMMAMFNNISNLTALRLFNDVDIRPAPSPAAGQNRINTPNRLVDQAKWQEVYSGINIWIYDALSNTDKCVRLVHQEGDVYGTATYVPDSGVFLTLTSRIYKGGQLACPGDAYLRDPIQHGLSWHENQFWRSGQMGL